jgi:hypothetical protein
MNGGVYAFTIYPYADREALAAFILADPRLTQGAEVEAFEREFAAAVGAAHACAVSSCTTALHLALLAAGVRPGDEVITVSHSFIATANSIRYCGATPVFVDIDYDNLMLRPELLEKAVTTKTRAMVPVHIAGAACELEPIIEIAKKHGVPVIEDAAHALGTRYQGRPIGSFPQTAIFSFQAIKHKCADMLMRVEAARSATYYAACTADERGPELPVAASLAKDFGGSLSVPNWPEARGLSPSDLRWRSTHDAWLITAAPGDSALEFRAAAFYSGAEVYAGEARSEPTAVS